MVVLSVPAGFRLEAMRQLPYYMPPAIRRLWSCGETVGNILDVPFISKNSQVRSALVLCHAHNVEARRHLYGIESPR